MASVHVRARTHILQGSVRARVRRILVRVLYRGTGRSLRRISPRPTFVPRTFSSNVSPPGSSSSGNLSPTLAALPRSRPPSRASTHVCRLSSRFHSGLETSSWARAAYRMSFTAFGIGPEPSLTNMPALERLLTARSYNISRSFIPKLGLTSRRVVTFSSVCGFR